MMMTDMTLQFATDAPFDAMTTPQLWQACIVIGTHKLEMRQKEHWTKQVDVFTPMNRRIDHLQNEEERRVRVR